ncbi:uncharacterized protein F4812DRAFT_368434 [Daldinia caldariorum]|uniref:uncharacterized protein n=1 Tax=Daldinia caldariorum TaxID=326644 RepID=UPI00200890C9|nr:uncharacterized protein F4812DRAFT_368434 [Daldinia caldariorum]KAI1468432.1 hypothetical protein F4812DRAFT_368434 [Daldinia caldariorum]
MLTISRFATTVRSSAGAMKSRIAYPYLRPTLSSHLLNQLTRVTTSKFSTSSSGLSAKRPTNDPSKQPDEIPPMGFSLEGLGMTRRTKIVVIIIISIYGTMETIFYARWFWHWYSGTEDNETESKA